MLLKTHTSLDDGGTNTHIKKDHNQKVTAVGGRDI